MARIAIELFGVPRLRAGTACVLVEASTVGEALLGLRTSVPAMGAIVLDGGEVHPAYRVCRNGDVFTGESTEPLAPGDVLLLLAADAGG